MDRIIPLRKFLRPLHYFSWLSHKLFVILIEYSTPSESCRQFRGYICRWCSWQL